MSNLPAHRFSSEITDIMEQMADAFPALFNSFDPQAIHTVFWEDKKCTAGAIKVRSTQPIYRIRYPDVAYTIEGFDDAWKEMTMKQKNLSVFRAMLHFHADGFDEESKNFGKVRKPDRSFFSEEQVLIGAIVDWETNADNANDPLQVGQKIQSDPDYQPKVPMTYIDIATVGSKSV